MASNHHDFSTGKTGRENGFLLQQLPLGFRLCSSSGNYTHIAESLPELHKNHSYS